MRRGEESKRKEDRNGGGEKVGDLGKGIIVHPLRVFFDRRCRHATCGLQIYSN
jgi:hypothetical protein